VTGAARGIGLGIAQRLAGEGCRVVMNDIDQDTLIASAAILAETHDILTVPGNISDENEVRDLFERAVAVWGGLDILVNNAARLVKRRWLSAVDLADFDEMMRVNVRGMYLCSRMAAVDMARRHGGAIINISSVGANRAFRGQVAYIASKGAIEAMTRALAMDLAPYGIRVNSIGPGMIAAHG
jgi:NAD(P)-dependent dehydrogenase (short-subunit alcohol dehydrogenase family)